MTTSKKTKDVINKLEELQKQSEKRFDYVQISAAAQEVLFAVYEAGVSNATFTSEDKQEISRLLPAAILGFGFRIFTLENSFSSFSTDTIRIERSGLQYVLDDYSKFPTNPEDQNDLTQKFSELTDQEDLDGLDECLRRCEFDFYRDCPRGKDFLKEIDNLPPSHWWFRDDFEESDDEEWVVEESKTKDAFCYNSPIAV